MGLLEDVGVPTRVGEYLGFLLSLPLGFSFGFGSGYRLG